eukprot:scaffold78425_cov26-Attheya_sp.AAC.1
MGCSVSTPASAPAEELQAELSGGNSNASASPSRPSSTGSIDDRTASTPAAAATTLSILTMKHPDLAGNKDLVGVSVYYLQNIFLKEVEAAGLSRDSTIYDLENLNGPAGLIRKKGVDVVCPIVNTRGAAYVHCLEGADNVGGATHMLSYTWGYKIGDIVDTLVDVCRQQRLEPKRTYFWICFLCINQHSVVRDSKHGKNVLTQVFLEAFECRVSGIGRIVCMMAPWNAPTYLTRVWCIFEVATAFQNKACDVIVVMPPEQKKLIEELLVGEGDTQEGLDALYEALASTKVQDGKASVEADRQHILALVEAQDGGYMATNVLVNMRLRAWVRSVLEDLVKKKGTKVETQGGTEADQLAYYARFCYKVGVVFNSNGEYDAALVEWRKGLAIEEVALGKNHPSTAASYGNIGLALNNKGDFDAALVEYHKCLAIQEVTLGKNHPDTATCYNNIGGALDSKGGYDAALVEYRKALAIQEVALGKNHPSTATTYTNIGSVLHRKGDFDAALVEYHKGLAIREVGDFDAALVEYRKCLAIREVALGKNHPDTALSYNNIGGALNSKGDLDAALVEFRKCLAIREVALGKNHPSTATTYSNIGLALHNK